MSIREQQKSERKKAMLVAATVLFKEHGFQKTTMDMIAERAGFGVATLYKYVQSKGGIIRELVTPDMLMIFELGERIIQNPPDDPADAMSALIKCYRRIGNNWNDKWLMRLISVPLIPEDRVLSSLVEFADTKVMEQIRDLLRVLQFRGHVTQGLDVSDMATILFAVFNHEYLVYVMHDDTKPDQAFSNIDRLLRTLFQPWRTIGSVPQKKNLRVLRP